MLWQRVDKLTWMCDDCKQGYSSIVSPCGDNFRVEIFYEGRRLIAYKDLHPVEAMRMSELHIRKHSEKQFTEKRSYAY